MIRLDMAVAAGLILWDEEIQKENHRKWILQMSYEENYDTGMGLLDYPSPSNLITKIRQRWKFNK